MLMPTTQSFNLHPSFPPTLHQILVQAHMSLTTPLSVLRICDSHNATFFHKTYCKFANNFRSIPFLTYNAMLSMQQALLKNTSTWPLWLDGGWLQAVKYIMPDVTTLQTRLHTDLTNLVALWLYKHRRLLDVSFIILRTACPGTARLEPVHNHAHGTQWKLFGQ